MRVQYKGTVCINVTGTFSVFGDTVAFVNMQVTTLTGLFVSIRGAYVIYPTRLGANAPLKISGDFKQSWGDLK